MQIHLAQVTQQDMKIYYETNTRGMQIHLAQITQQDAKIYFEPIHAVECKYIWLMFHCYDILDE